MSNLKLLENLEETSKKFKEKLNNKIIKIITHLDTDGITSAAILSKAFQRLDIKFSVRVVKYLEESLIYQLEKEIKKEDILIFLDLGSGSLDKIKNIKGDIFILDHHRIPNNLKNKELAKNIFFINPLLYDKEEISASCITYLFTKFINKKNEDLADLAILGLVGDVMDKQINEYTNIILKDALKHNTILRKGLSIFSSTRPIHKSLELSSSVFIPGVTGSPSGSIELLREAGIEFKENGNYRTLLDLKEEEISRLITSIVLRRAEKKNPEDIISNIFLIKVFGRLEDARELSALINACSRLGYPDIALAFCLGSSEACTKAESIYNNYKYKLINGLNLAHNKKIIGEGYVIVNAKNEIKDTLIGTIMSIIASSLIYPEGTILVGMAYSKDKIKVSLRVSGFSGPKEDLTKILDGISKIVDIEFGGHEKAAGCIVKKKDEELFLEILKKELSMNSIKIKIKEY